MMLTACRPLSGQRSTGPSGVADHSNSLKRSAISPWTADVCDEVSNGHRLASRAVAREHKPAGPQAADDFMLRCARLLLRLLMAHRAEDWRGAGCSAPPPSDRSGQPP